MRLVLLGAPGSGKGTQADLLREKYGFVHISTGDILRKNLEEKTELGLCAEDFMNKGELVPDAVIIDMAKERLKEDDVAKGFLMDGFPRTIPQAQAFEKMLDEVISVQSVSIEEKRLTLDVNLNKDIPQYIVSDEIRLAQVLTNLLANAVKFTPEDGAITLTAKLIIGDNNDESIMRVEVADNGIGIPAEQQAILFGDFMQVESDAARKFGGTGLGLAISKRIVEMMGGSIWVESKVGEGSRFIFTFPVRSSSAADVASHTDFSAAVSDEIDCFKGYTILVAEDVEINREIVSALLEPTGIEIECAFDGTQTVQMFRDAPERYDLIFMDIQMPGMDGITATRLIRELGTEKAKNIPIVAMTANVFKEDIDACLAAGMNDHLSKPLDLGQIMAKLRLYL
jgi:adenylate kinase family enzyme